METKCHAWLIFPDFYELRAFFQIWGHPWYEQFFKVVIGVARGTPSGDLAIACNCTYSSSMISFWYFFTFSRLDKHRANPERGPGDFFFRKQQKITNSTLCSGLSKMLNK